MSIDTTCLILVKNGNYHVGITQAVENITHHKDLNSVARFIQTAEAICFNEEDAYKIANSIKLDASWRIEYGILLFNFDTEEAKAFH